MHFCQQKSKSPFANYCVHPNCNCQLLCACKSLQKFTVGLNSVLVKSFVVPMFLNYSESQVQPTQFIEYYVLTQPLTMISVDSTINNDKIFWPTGKNRVCNDQWWSAGFPAGQVSVHDKSFNITMYSDTDYEHDKCQTLHDGSTNWALPIHTTFSDYDCISSFNWKIYVLQLSWNFVGLLITSSRSWMYHYFCLFLHMFKNDNWHISLFEKKMWPFFFSHW